MDRRKDIKRVQYCRQQASECMTAAEATVIAEVREAYLQLAEGWRRLAPKAAEVSGDRPGLTIGDKIEGSPVASGPRLPSLLVHGALGPAGARAVRG